jgi:hypothetical protein
MKNQSIINRIAVISGLALGAFALSAVADWSNPSQAPTQGNVPAPINVGVADGSSQVKLNTLQVNGNLGTLGTLTTALLTVNNGSSATANSVLTDVNGDGKATWVAPGGGIGDCHSTPLTIDPGPDSNPRTFHNDTNYRQMVIVSNNGSGQDLSGFVSSSPTINVSSVYTNPDMVASGGANIENRDTISFVVPAGYYYRILNNAYWIHTSVWCF